MEDQNESSPPPKNVVISLCDKTGNMVKPWNDAGFECYCIDIQHSIRRDQYKCGINYIWGDVRSWRLPAALAGRVAIIFAFPPCTHLSSSGARDHQKKSGWMLVDALQAFDSCEVAASFSLNDLVIQPETEAERLILLHLSKRKARITPATGGDKAFLNLYLTFDDVLNPTNR